MKKLVIITSGAYPSQGVLNLIKYISYSLIKNTNFKKKYNLKIFIFEENFLLKVKKIIYNLYLIIQNIFSEEKKRIHKFSNSAKIFLKENDKIKNRIVFFSKNNIYKNYLPDLVFPIQDTKIPKNFKTLGYIYDLQHIDLPKFFNKSEIKKRNQDFKNIINNTDGILVNSFFVKKGILKNFKIKKKNLNVIPFLPYLYDTNLKMNNNIKKKYNLKNDFFIICNHFWRHKNHQIAFQAFKNLQLQNKKFDLVCTGITEDSRFPNYFGDLKKKFNKQIIDNKIKILNLIPRSDQLELIKNSLGVIQPSLYEGGPGGFSSYEAISLKKCLIISDLKINKEIKYKNIIFFKKNSSKDLTKKLLIVLNKKKQIKKSQDLSKINQKKLGNYFLKLIDKILND